MTLIKTPEEIEILREGGKILAEVRNQVASLVKPGITTQSLENEARKLISKAGAKPAFLGYKNSQGGHDYPAALCTSLNDEVVHCSPSEDRVLTNGDILSIDIGVEHKGLFTDSAVTVSVGELLPEVRKLLEATEKALFVGIEQVKPENTLGDVAHAIQEVGEGYGLGVIRELVGHGVGHEVHEKPDVPNYGKKGQGMKLEQGMVLAIEPMFTMGDWKVRFLEDRWTVSTADGSLSAHFEHTVAVTEKGSIILTK